MINLNYRGKLLGRATGEGESPVLEIVKAQWVWYLSRVGHEESCLNLGGPPSKAKYWSLPIEKKYREGKVKRTP